MGDRGGLKRGRQQSTRSGRSLPSIAMPVHAPHRTFAVRSVLAKIYKLQEAGISALTATKL